MRQARDNPSARAIEVQSGDTLYDISRRYSVNMRALIETNALDAPYALDKGDVIYLPPPNVHVVEKGETLYSVSRRYNVDTRSLALLNHAAAVASLSGQLMLLLPAREQAREVIACTDGCACVLSRRRLTKTPVAKTPVAACRRQGDLACQRDGGA
jgi:murein DD-endopeptidase MepM/ murein hydrolase activator NlpD